MTLDPQLGSSILASVEQGFADQVSFTQELMRFTSLRGEEHAVQDFVFRALRDRGYAVERFEMDRAALERHPGAGAFSAQHSRAPIVVGIHRPRQERGRSLAPPPLLGGAPPPGYWQRRAHTHFAATEQTRL